MVGFVHTFYNIGCVVTWATTIGLQRVAVQTRAAPTVLFVAFTHVGASLVGAPDQLYGLSIGLKTPVTRQMEV